VGLRNGIVEWILGAVQENVMRAWSRGTRNILNCKVEVRKGGCDVREELDHIYIYIYIGWRGAD